jgi:hypothetical protein
MFELDPKTTALILIDLQKGIMSHELKPYPADRVAKAGSTLADTFRKAGAPVVIVNVGFAKDFKDALRQPVDQPFAAPPGGFPEKFQRVDRWIGKAWRHSCHQAPMGRLPWHGAGSATAPPRYPDNRSGGRRNEHRRRVDGATGVGTRLCRRSCRRCHERHVR